MFKKIGLISKLVSFFIKHKKTYTIEEFMQDENLRNKYLNKCRNGELPPDELNCVNARSAEKRLFKQSLENIRKNSSYI